MIKPSNTSLTLWELHEIQKSPTHRASLLSLCVIHRVIVQSAVSVRETFRSHTQLLKQLHPSLEMVQPAPECKA